MVTVLANDDIPALPDITVRFAPSPGTLSTPPTHAGPLGFRIASFPEPDPPAGYVFVGWFSNGTQVHAPVAAIRNTTFLAAYAPIPDPYCTDRFVIVYDAGLGQLPQGVRPIQGLAYGYPLTSLPIPEKDGYTFDGWTWNGEPISAPIIVRGDMAIEAVWVRSTANQPASNTTYPFIPIPNFHFAAVFNPFPGVFVGDEIGIRIGRNSQTIRNAPEDPTRSDAIFIGWALPNGQTLDNPLIIRGDTTLTALWDTSEEAVASLTNPSAQVDTRPNPQTSPFTLSLILICAGVGLGLSAIGILYLTKKQAAAKDKYHMGMIRYVREARMVIKNRG